MTVGSVRDTLGRQYTGTSPGARVSAELPASSSSFFLSASHCPFLSMLEVCARAVAALRFCSYAVATSRTFSKWQNMCISIVDATVVISWRCAISARNIPQLVRVSQAISSADVIIVSCMDVPFMRDITIWNDFLSPPIPCLFPHLEVLLNSHESNHHERDRLSNRGDKKGLQYSNIPRTSCCPNCAARFHMSSCIYSPWSLADINQRQWSY
jgi:hypothetical protein